MNLQQFVAETIVEISKGINEANEKSGKESIGVKVNPANSYNDGKNSYIVENDNAKPGNKKNIENIKFDVAVTVNESEMENGEGGGGIQIAGFQVGAKAGMESTSSSQNTSRIQFEIPIVFPTA